ncbi:MAG: aminotransferase class I/II-fold pyridoxal phosphate-dependent enzyme [Bacteroidota bacterium]
MKDRIYLSSPHMCGNEMKYINEAFEKNWVAPLGPNVDNFEAELADYLKTGHVAALSSGTAAIHLALILLGIKTGDEVLVSGFTFSASVNPIVYQGAIPVLVDSEDETWNISPVLLRKAILDRISKGKKPKAIILVHLYGMPAKVEEIMKISGEFNIPVIEDAAEALGSFYKNKHVGIYGDMGVLSFNGNKIITTSGGGALFSNRKEFIEKARFLATQARDKSPFYQHSHIGFNYRMSNVLAGIGRGQLSVISDRVEARRNNFLFYKDLFKNIEGTHFLEEPEGHFSNRWLTTILINPNASHGVTPDTLREKLEKENIECRPLWKPMHLQPVFADCPSYVDGTSEKLFNNGICLPSGSNLTNEQKQRIKENILKIFNP